MNRLEERQRQGGRETERERDRERERQRDRERQRETGWERDRERETERERDRERETDRETDRERQREVTKKRIIGTRELCEESLKERFCSFNLRLSLSVYLSLTVALSPEPSIV
jgi:hypothetical protein